LTTYSKSYMGFLKNPLRDPQKSKMADIDIETGSRIPIWRTLGEFNVMIPEPRVTLQSAAT